MDFAACSWLVLLFAFAMGLVLIIKGGDAFVEAAAWIAEAGGIPQIVVGATVVSLATTMPEQMVSFFAAADGNVNMAVGNAVGSVTANTGLIMALALLAMPGPAPRALYLRKSLLLLWAVSVLTIFTRNGSLEWLGCGLLVAVFVLFAAENLHYAHVTPEAIEAGNTKQARADTAKWCKMILYFLLGAGAICGGARLLIVSAEEIAHRLRVPDIVIAVTIVAVGTSLPELVTTLTAITKGKASLSMGNIIGANILDTSLILPICGLIGGRRLPINGQSLHWDIPICLICTGVALIPVCVTQKFRRWQGAVLLCIYLGYLIHIFSGVK